MSNHQTLASPKDHQNLYQPYSSSLDPELESRINKIMKNIPAHIKQNIQEDQTNSSQITITSHHQSKPLPNRVQKSPEDLTYSRWVHTNEIDEKQLKKTSKIEGYSDSLQEGDAIIQKTIYQENLNKRLSEAIRRTKNLTDSLHQSPAPKVTVQGDINPGVNLDSISQKVEKAIQRTHLNLKLSGEFNIPGYVSPSNQSNAQQYFSTAEKTKNQNMPTSPSVIQSRLFASEQKMLLQSPTQSTSEYAKKEYSYTTAKKNPAKNIDEIFNEAMKRSQSVLKRNEELSKSSNPKSFLLNQSIDSSLKIDPQVEALKLSYPKSILEGIDIKANEAKADKASSYLQEEDAKFNVAKFDLGGSYVEKPESKPDITKFQLVNHTLESKLGQYFASPMRASKELHIFNNAVINLSPAQKPKMVEENYSNGSAYKGEKLGGKKNGRGTFTYEDGSKYEGEWEDDLRSGYGTKTFSNGEIEYEGEWTQDKYHGNGNITNLKPRQLKDEEFDYKDFDKLDGAWVKYEGEFAFGKWNGLGKLYLSNDEKYIGRFKIGEIDGAGTFYQKSGVTITGEWKHNKFLGAL